MMHSSSPCANPHGNPTLPYPTLVHPILHRIRDLPPISCLFASFRIPQLWRSPREPFPSCVCMLNADL